MSFNKQIAKHFREIHFGGNWTCSNMKDQLSDITWQQAVQQVYNLNSIAILVFHCNYYVSAVLKVLQGEALIASDKESFACPPIQSEANWQNLINKTLSEAEAFANLLEEVPEHKLLEIFVDEKYGIYYRNLHGIIEHTHYHLGQIAVIKKLLLQSHRK
ncbi:MAG: DUF1572 domain-containing protein [Bacteroidetes bacterium]|nr:DUF1572 domain-containing protein [Bacteroidota bacterium]